MAVTYSSAVKDNRMTQVLNAIDGGAGAGYIEICSAAYAAVLATLTLSDPCGSVETIEKYQREFREQEAILLLWAA